MSYIDERMGTEETVGGISLFESIRSNHLVTHDYAGFMSAPDKIKLDGIAENANNYTHPLSPLAKGRYLFVTVDEYGHAVDGKVINDGTLEEHEITDAYIKNGEIHLGKNAITPLTAASNLATDKLTGVIKAGNLPNAIADYGINDLYIKNGTVTMGQYAITPLTAESKLSADKLTGTIKSGNLPNTLADYGINDLYIKNGTVTMGQYAITPLTAESKLSADKLTGTIKSGNLPNTLADYGINDLAIKNGTIIIGSSNITPLTESSQLAVDGKNMMEKFKDSIPFTQEEKDKLYKYSDTQSCLLRKTLQGNVVVRPLSVTDVSGRDFGDAFKTVENGFVAGSLERIDGEFFLRDDGSIIPAPRRFSTVKISRMANGDMIVNPLTDDDDDDFDPSEQVELATNEDMDKLAAKFDY